MAKFRIAKTSFLGGEISPTAFGRVDLNFYNQSCITLRNMIPLVSGGCYRRPGTFYESNGGIEGSTTFAPALFPFIYSQDEVYAIGINKTLALDGILNSYRPTGNTSRSTGATVTSAHSYDESTVDPANLAGAYDEWHSIQYAQSADRLYLAHPNHPPLFVNRTAASVFSTNQFDSGLSGANLRDGWPFLEQNITTNRMGVSGTTGAITVWTGTAFFNSGHVGSLIKIDDGAGIVGAARITAFTSSTTVSATTCVDFGVPVTAANQAAVLAGGGRLTWWESAWSDYRGWPRTVCFFQDRLCFGGNAYRPDSIWFSQTSSYTTFSNATIFDPRSSPTGSQPFTRQLLSTQLNLIQWMSPEKSLAVGTTGDEWLINREDPSFFGADSCISETQSHFGSSYNQAIRIGNELIFCTKDEETLRSFVFNFQEDSYSSEPIQILYDEFPRVDKSTKSRGNRKIRKFSWDKSRDTIWCLDTAGNFVGLTRDRRIPYSAWHSHRFAGYNASDIPTSGFTSGGYAVSDPNYINCAGSVVTFEVVPNPTNGMNDVWLAVKRKTSGVFVYDIERMIGKNIPGDSAYSYIDSGIGQYFTDASSWYNNASTYTADGITYGAASGPSLAHLVGKTPAGTAFNSYGIFDFTGSAVTASTTDIQSPKPTGITALGGTASPTYPTSVTIGLRFEHVLEPVRIEVPSPVGTSQAAIKKIHELTIRFYKTLACSFGRDADNLESINFRTPELDMGQSAELFTGDKRRVFNGDQDRDGLVYLSSDKALPCCIISLIAEGVSDD